MISDPDPPVVGTGLDVLPFDLVAKRLGFVHGHLVSREDLLLALIVLDPHGDVRHCEDRIARPDAPTIATMSDDYHLPAAICRRGHVVTRDATSALRTAKCATCGADVLTECPSCGNIIRGSYIVPGVIGFSKEYSAPDFCGDCGKPFPWASRQARIYELMDLLEAEGLDPAAELKAREQLQALADADEDEEADEARWLRVKRLAPTLWEKSGAQQIITTLVLAEGRVRLGLPPV